MTFPERGVAMAGLLRGGSINLFVTISRHVNAGRHRVEAAGLALPLRPHYDWLEFKNPEAPAVQARGR